VGGVEENAEQVYIIGSNRNNLLNVMLGEICAELPRPEIQSEKVVEIDR